MDWLNLLVRKGDTLWRLSRAERWLLLQALGLLPLVAISLKMAGLRRTQSLLSRFIPVTVRPSSGENLLLPARTTARMVRVATRYNLPWANCLKKSLVLWWLLRCQGIECDLQIGVRHEQNKFEAHAWVEYDGIVLNDSQNVRSHFAMFERPIEVKV